MAALSDSEIIVNQSGLGVKARTASRSRRRDKPASVRSMCVAPGFAGFLLHGRQLNGNLDNHPPEANEPSAIQAGTGTHVARIHTRITMPAPPVKIGARRIGRTSLSARVSEELMRILVCPQTKAPLVQEGDWLYSTDAATRRRYPIVDGIPIMLIDQSQVVDEAEFRRVMDDANSSSGSGVRLRAANGVARASAP